MRTFLYSLFFLILLSCQEGRENASEASLDQALKIHQRTTTIDTHIDIDIENFTDSMNYRRRLDTQVDLPKMEEGGLDVAWLIVYTGQDSLTEAGFAKAGKNAMAKFEAIHRLCEELAPDKIQLALTSEDVRLIVSEGKKVAMIGVENAYPMGHDLSQFKAYHDMGARYVSLAHNGHNQFADSHTGEEDGEWLHNGLSELGKEAVKEMNRLGIMIDVSHPSKEAMKQMISLSKAPIIASHSSARGLCDHSRNLDDEQLRLIQANGGVVQTVALDAYLNCDKVERLSAYKEGLYRRLADSLGLDWDPSGIGTGMAGAQRDSVAAIRKKIIALGDSLSLVGKDRPAAVDVGDFVDHIDYMVNRIGIDHVGISSDFDGGGGIKGWSDASETFGVTLELVRRGYDQEEIAKLWGGNLLRVLDEVQALAEK